MGGMKDPSKNLTTEQGDMGKYSMYGDALLGQTYINITCSIGWTTPREVTIAEFLIQVKSAEKCENVLTTTRMSSLDFNYTIADPAVPGASSEYNLAINKLFNIINGSTCQDLSCELKYFDNL